MGSHVIANRIIAFLVFLIASVVYLMTAGPSICFWDCGEFLAASACMGLPHPPGTPLLIPIGKVFLLGFSFLKDPGFRANLMAVFGSALVVMLIYLIIVRALTFAFGEPDTMWKRLVMYVSGFTGALFCAFSNTFWFCSLEASEQCNFCLLPVALTIWLVLIWAKTTDERLRDRLLLLITYIGYVGIGMHMISMITLPAVFLFVMIVDEKKRRDWRLWLFGLVLALAMYNLSWFIFAGCLSVCAAFMMTFGGPRLAKGWRYFFWACFLALLIGLEFTLNPPFLNWWVIAFWAAAVVVVPLSSGGKDYPKWRFAVWFLAMGLLGFSNHLFMPVRSSLNPIIDENHPVTWEAFTSMLDRKQYGSESMISRSLWRRGDLAHQFGIEGHMGYGGFHITQFFHFRHKDDKLGDVPVDTEKNFVIDPEGWAQLFVYLIPIFFMLWGWFYLWRRHRNVAILLIVVTLLTGIIMAWYMNFADGTKCERRDYEMWMQQGRPGPEPLEHREVRVRDYFYNAGFMFYGMWMGLAAGCFLFALGRSRKQLISRLAAPVALVFFAVSPALPLTQNYKLRDRHWNWTPYDYAYNLLMTCDKDALLVTNGDNDTFPLWAIQEAYGVRRDVRLINLSLLNTDWYIKQLKNVEPKAPISFSDHEIDAGIAPTGNPYDHPFPYTLPKAKISVTLPGRDQTQYFRTQDRMVLDIVDANAWKKPFFFSVTVGEDNFMGLQPYLKMEGLAWRLMPQPVSKDKMIDLDRTIFLLENVYKINPLPDVLGRSEETIRNMLSDYTACYLQTVYTLRGEILQEKAEIDAAAKSAHPPADLKVRQAKFDADLQMALDLSAKGIAVTPSDWRLPMVRQELLLTCGKIDLAKKLAQDALKANPEDEQFHRLVEQVNMYEALGSQPVGHLAPR